MFHAKNYENLSKFVRSYGQNTVGRFFPDMVYLLVSIQNTNVSDGQTD